MRKSYFILPFFGAVGILGPGVLAKAEVCTAGETYAPSLIGPWVIDSYTERQGGSAASPGDPFLPRASFPGSGSAAIIGPTLNGRPPTVGISFAGARQADSQLRVIPPDTMGAVGPDHFMEVINDHVSVYRKSDGQRIASEPLELFFSGIATGYLGDPRVLFDHHSGRWIAIATDFGGGLIALAVSLTSDPTGPVFKTYFVAATGSDSAAWPDYPTLGVDINGIYIGAWMVGQSMTLWSIDKLPLVASSPGMGTVTAWRGLEFSGGNQPAHTYGNPGTEYIIGKSTQSALRIYEVKPPLTSPTMCDNGTIPVSEFGFPPDAPAKNSTVPIDTVGDRLMMSVFREGSLWTTHCINVDGRAAIRWYQINPATRTVTQWGNVSDLALHYYIPSLMVNSAGHVAMGFSGSDVNHFVGAYYTGRRANDAEGDMAIPILLKAGEIGYQAIDNIGRNRWGDYSYTSLDPVDQSTFWTIQEYAARNSSNFPEWGTWVASMGFLPCSSADHCDDANGCTIDSCIDGLCDNKALDGTICEEGICCHGLCTPPNCMSDTECDDHHYCTIDACANSGTCGARCDYTDVPGCIACGDGACSAGESPCNCRPDCGNVHPEGLAETCRDEIDNDCDGLIDCDDVQNCALDESACFCFDSDGDNGPNPLICIDWTGEGPPIAETNFTLELESASEPSITFVTSNTGWKIWSQQSRTIDTPKNLGPIKIDPTVVDASFGVTIAHGGLPGAANIGSIDLVKSGWTGLSNVSGSVVGNVSGGLAVQAAGGQGGIVSFTIGGDLNNSVILPKVDTFIVNRAISATSTINIQSFVGNKLVEFNRDGGVFAGDLVISNPTPVNTIVKIHGSLTDMGSIVTSDFAGHLSLRCGSGAQSVINMGTMSGTVELSNSSYQGALNIGSLASVVGTAQILMRNTTLKGAINIAGNCNGGVFLAPGSVTPSGGISIGGTQTGSIYVQGNCDGGIMANGSLNGVIEIGGALGGNLCGSNLQSNLIVPPTIQIGCGIGHDGTICGQEPVCPAGDIQSSLAWPPHGTKDARQPYPMGPAGTPVPLDSRQGIGSPNPDAPPEDKIKMSLTSTGAIPTAQMRAISHDCWALCETGTEPVDTGTAPLSANKISCVAERDDPTTAIDDPARYEIRLDRPISARQWTTIRYAPGASRVIYASLPGNISGDTRTNSIDLIRRIDCLNGQTWQCGSTVWTQDLDHSGEFVLGPDYGFTFVELWNGAGNFLPWQQTQLPANTCVGSSGGGGGGEICPVAPCGEDPGPMSMTMGGFGEGLEESSMEAESSEFVEDENAIFSDWVIGFLAGANPQDEHAEQIFQESVDLIVQWCLANLGEYEKSALANGLSDSGLTFASSIGQDAAAMVVEFVTQ